MRYTYKEEDAEDVELYERESPAEYPEYPTANFYLLQILGGLVVFILGMRFAIRRAPLWPLVLYRLFRRMP